MLPLSETEFNNCWQLLPRETQELFLRHHHCQTIHHRELHDEADASPVVDPSALQWHAFWLEPTQCFRVTYFETFNWMRTSKSLLTWRKIARNHTKLETQRTQLETLETELLKAELGQHAWQVRKASPRDDIVKTVALVFLEDVMEKLFEPLEQCNENNIEANWKKHLLKTTQRLAYMEIILNGHCWMMVCSPTDGKLCIAATPRHQSRVNDISEKVKGESNSRVLEDVCCGEDGDEREEGRRERACSEGRRERACCGLRGKKGACMLRRERACCVSESAGVCMVRTQCVCC